MKYLFLLIAAFALVGTATATSQSDCCTGGACCAAHLGCCAK